MSSAMAMTRVQKLRIKW